MTFEHIRIYSYIDIRRAIRKGIHKSLEDLLRKGVTMKKPKSKLTYAEIMQIVMNMGMQLEKITQAVIMNEKALDEYVKFKDDKKGFIGYLEKNYNDTTNEEIKEEQLPG